MASSSGRLAENVHDMVAFHFIETGVGDGFRPVVPAASDESQTERRAGPRASFEFPISLLIFTRPSPKGDARQRLHEP